MNDALELQVRDYTNVVVDSVEPLSMTEILERPVGDGAVRPVIRQSQRRSSRDNLLAATGTALALAGIVIVAVLIGRNTAPSEPNPQSDVVAPSTLAEEIPTTAVHNAPPTVPLALTLDAWVQSEWTGAGPTWVTAYPSGGFVASGPGMSAKFSADGLEWTDEPFHPQLEGYRDLYIEGRFALANAIPNDPREGSRRFVAGQKGTGGHVWETLLEFEAGKWTVWDVGVPVMDPPVELGDLTLIPIQNDGGSRYDYLTTSDGQTFDRHRLRPYEGMGNDPKFFAYTDAILGNQDGVAFYLTTDGINWQPVDLPDFSPDHGLVDIVHFFDLDDRVVAQDRQAALLWESTDGLQWTASSEPDAPWSDGVRMLHRTAAGFVLTVTQEGLPGYAIWTSPDGVEWTSVDGPPTTLTSSDLPVFRVARQTVFLLMPNRSDAAMWVGSLTADEDE